MLNYTPHLALLPEHPQDVIEDFFSLRWQQIQLYTSQLGCHQIIQQLPYLRVPPLELAHSGSIFLPSTLQFLVTCVIFFSCFRRIMVDL